MSATVTRIETTRFGAVEVAREAVVRFPRGLYGLEEARAYCLLPHQAGSCFQWLQAADSPATAMLVTDPFLFFRAYEISIPDAAADLLQAADPASVAIYAPVTVSAERRELYANLLGPIVINLRAGIGMQLIQDGSRYSTRHRIGGEAAGLRHSGVQAFRRSGRHEYDPNARTPERLNAERLNA